MKMTTMNLTYVFLVFILVFLIFISMSSCCVKFQPYSEQTIFSKQFPFEAMTNARDVSNNFMAMLTPTATPSATPISYMNMPMDNTEGFTSMGYSDYGKDGKIDIFSGTKGSLDCDRTSSNLTNSQGGLCLNDTQMKMLRTRGGNSQCGDAQIGK